MLNDLSGVVVALEKLEQCILMQVENAMMFSVLCDLICYCVQFLKMRLDVGDVMVSVLFAMVKSVGSVVSQLMDEFVFVVLLIL